VSSIWNSDGLHQAASSSVHLIVLNESNSPFGAGWTVAGAQRAYVQSDGVLVTDGSGSATFFTGNCAPNTNCTFAAPSGEFSTFKLSYSNYHRLYPDGTDLNFYLDGRIVMHSDRFGNYNFYTYNGPNGTLNMIQDPVYYGIIFGFEDGSGGWKVGTLRSIQTPGGRTAWFGVDGNNDLRQTLNVDQAYWEYTDYDGSHRLNHYRDRRAGDWNFSYASDGTLASQVAPTVTINGTAQRPTTTQVGPSTNVINAIQGTVGYQGNPIPSSIDKRGRLTNPRGGATYYTLNLWGQSTLTTDVLGRNTTSVYDANTGQLTSITKPNGRNIQYSYDGPRLTYVHDYGTGQTVNTAYELTYSRPTHVWGNTVEQWFYYTGARLDSSRYGSSNSAVTKYVTDAKGRVWKSTDPAGHADSTFFGPAGGLENIDSTVAPGHRVTAYRYDAYGRTRAVIPPSGYGDSTIYDLLNRVVGKVNIYTQRRTSWTYDALYLTTITDARANSTTYTRNALGWTEREHRAGSANDLVKTFDANGNVLTSQNRRQQTVSFTYDALDRVTQKSMASGNIVYAYGWSDDFASASNGASVDTMFYDAADRLARVKTWRGGTWSWYNLQYTYNPDGTRARLDATSNMWTGNRGPQYSYYPSGALQYLTDFGKQSALSVNGENLATTLGFPSIANTVSNNTTHENYENSFTPGTNADYRLGVTGSLDAAGRISERLRHADNDSLRDFSYNPDGSLATRRLWSSTQPSCTFTADAGIVCTEGSYNLVGSETYSYDEVGNLMNGVTSIDYPGNRIRAANGYSFDYDADGNLISKTGPGFTQTLQWNEVGQLTSVTTNGHTTNFTYDGFGRRVSGDTYYLYDGANLFMELTSGGNVTAEYAYLPGTDHPLMVSRGTELLYFAMDPTSGSVHGLIRDGDAVVRAQYGFTPFGQLEAGSFDNTQNGANPLRFAAREYDASTGLYYFRSRYYDPQVGRFISEDPVGVSGGINLYAYAGNDPINGSDPMGTSFIPIGKAFKWLNKRTGGFAAAALGFGVTFLAAAAGPLTWSAALQGTSEAFGAMALGSFAAATVETVARGSPDAFGTIFRRDFNTAGAILGTEALVAATVGGGITAVGVNDNGPIQGFVESKKKLIGGGGFTLGPASFLTGEGSSTKAWLTAHELGHTIQFIALSAIGSGGGGILSYQWYPYLVMGGFGILGEMTDEANRLVSTGAIPDAGRWWECFASSLGGGACR
jgi:RHS repeat-associated protein